jgi:YVTN family beta-propeller protein
VAERERNEHEGDDDDDRRGDHGRDDDDDEEDGHHKGAVDVLLGPLSPNTANAFNFALGTIIDVGKRPEGLAIRPPDGREVWVANRNDDSISIIDRVTDTLIATVALRVKEVRGRREHWREIGKKPVAVVFSPDGQFAYVLARNSNNLIVLDTAKAISDPANAILSWRLEVGNKPVALAVSPEGSKLYIVNRNSDRVAVVDMTNPAAPVLLGQIRVGEEPEGIAILPDGTKLYVTSSETNSVWVYDIQAGSPYLTLRSVVPVGKEPGGIALTKPGSFVDGDYVYVANREDNTVSVIDTTRDTVIATIPVGKGPKGVAAGIVPTTP